MAPAPPPVELATPLAALVLLLRGRDVEGKDKAKLCELSDSLSEVEQAALTDFEVAFQRCLGALDATTLAALRGLAESPVHSSQASAVPSPVPGGSPRSPKGWASVRRAAGYPGHASPSQRLAGHAADSATAIQAAAQAAAMARKLFEQFDEKGEGEVNSSHFREMLWALGLGKHFSESELDQMVSAVDKNGDGAISLDEFTAWLYAGGGQLVARLAAMPDDENEEEQEHKAATNDDTARVERSLRAQLISAREAKEKLENALKDTERARSRELRRLEDNHEADAESEGLFWGSVVKNSAAPKLGKIVPDIGSAELIGNGNYGFVLLARRVSNEPVVVKLVSTRWAHVAVKEWKFAQILDGHPGVVGCSEEVVLHADEDKSIAAILKAAQEDGSLKLKAKRAAFPDRFLCLFQEYMNRGTVESWAEKEQLTLGGVLVVMRVVAGALAHMHRLGVTHNDVKPANILVKQDERKGPRSEVTVKLADLGLMCRSSVRTTDYTQYGMTVFCMLTGEKFGTRKYQSDMMEELASEAEALIAQARKGASSAGRPIVTALGVVPDLLRRIWKEDITMKELEAYKELQTWSFFDDAA